MSNSNISENAYENNLPNNQALRIGLMTSVLNPKAALNLFALFTNVVSPGTPPYVKLILIPVLSIITFSWHTMVGLIFFHGRLRELYRTSYRKTELTFEIVLIAFGLRIAFSKK